MTCRRTWNSLRYSQFHVGTPPPPPIPNVQSVFACLSQLHFSGGSIEYTASELDDFVAEMEAKVSQFVIGLIGFLPKFRKQIRPIRQRFEFFLFLLTPRELSIGILQYRRARQSLKLRPRYVAPATVTPFEKPRLRHSEGDSGTIASCMSHPLGILIDGVWCGEGYRGYRRRDPMLLLVRLVLTLSNNSPCLNHNSRFKPAGEDVFNFSRLGFSFFVSSAVPS